MDRINLGLGIPRYQQLAQAIADSIARGEYPVGSLLPGEEDLCRQFNFSRFTVREALRHLQETGLVNRRQGIGTTVIAATPARKFGHLIESIDELQQYAVEHRLVGHVFEDVVADSELAAELGCAPGMKFLRITALRVPIETADRTPIAWTRIHLAGVYAGIRSALPEHTGTIGSLVEKMYGQKITAIRQTISATAIEPSVAKALDVPANSPGLRIDRTYAGRDGTPFEFATSIHPGPRFSLSMQLDWLNPA
jgi:DNA-binding GntR family transcriptional regulator